jgi:signal transduction histidine kinase
MLAGVSHEISNPLAAIHSMVQILQSRRGVTPETLEKGLDSIAGSVARVLAITRKLGNFSRSAGEAPEPQALDAAVSEALTLLRQSRFGDAVHVTYDGMPEAMTRARPGELQQVFFNVLLNAAQAMDGKGSIEVRAERVGPRQLRVRMHDDGPGIPEHVLTRIFEPFFTTKPPGEGTGLGLAICYEIVQEVGGSMSAVNHPGGGACVDIVLPEAA